MFTLNTMRFNDTSYKSDKLDICSAVYIALDAEHQVCAERQVKWMTLRLKRTPGCENTVRCPEMYHEGNGYEVENGTIYKETKQGFLEDECKKA